MNTAKTDPVRPILRTLATVLTLLLLSGGPALAQVKDSREGVNFFDTGPLRIPEQFILGAGFLKLEPESADVLARGEWQVDAVQSITNNWTSSDSVEVFLEQRQRQPITLAELRSIDPVDGAGGLFFADGELYRGQVDLRYGLGAGFQLAVTVPYLDFRGGFGDGIIQESHDSLGVAQGGRLGVPEDRYTIYVRDRDGREVFRQGSPGSGVGDVTLALKKRFLQREGWLFAAEGTYKAATGEEADLFSSGSDDYGLQLLLTHYGDNDCWHLVLGASRLGEHEIFGLDDQTRLSGMLGYEHRLTTNSTWLFQLQVSESPLEGLGVRRLGKLQYLFDLGVKYALSPRTVGFIAISENFVEFTTSADVGLHFGLTWTP